MSQENKKIHDHRVCVCTRSLCMPRAPLPPGHSEVGRVVTPPALPAGFLPGKAFTLSLLLPGNPEPSAWWQGRGNQPETPPEGAPGSVPKNGNLKRCWYCHNTLCSVPPAKKGPVGAGPWELAKTLKGRMGTKTAGQRTRSMG